MNVLTTGRVASPHTYARPMAENGEVPEGNVTATLAGVVGSFTERIGGGSGGSPRRWTLPELAAGLLIAVVAILAIGGLATGIAGALGMSPGIRSNDLGDVLSQATEWSAPWVPLLLVAALAVTWWETGRWRASSHPLAPGESPGLWGAAPGTGPPLHVLRVRRLAICAGTLVALTAASSVIGLAASLGSLPHAPPAWQILETAFDSGSGTLATLLLCVTGFFATFRLIRTCPASDARP
jgi:hypothetical protein